MTRLIARLVLAMLLLPLTGAILVIGMALFAGGGPPPVAQLLALWAFVYTFIASYWVLLWYSVVRWTFARKSLTVGAGVGALLAGGLACLVLQRGSEIPLPAAMLIGGGLPPILWVLATVLIWRETPDERVRRLAAATGARTVACPMCGYNMTGLREARCPECGAAMTLDQLLSAQAPRDAVTLSDD